MNGVSKTIASITILFFVYIANGISQNSSFGGFLGESLFWLLILFVLPYGAGWAFGRGKFNNRLYVGLSLTAISVAYISLSQFETFGIEGARKIYGSYCKSIIIDGQSFASSKESFRLTSEYIVIGSNAYEYELEGSLVIFKLPSGARRSQDLNEFQKCD